MTEKQIQNIKEKCIFISDDNNVEAVHKLADECLKLIEIIREFKHYDTSNEFCYDCKHVESDGDLYWCELTDCIFELKDEKKESGMNEENTNKVLDKIAKILAEKDIGEILLNMDELKKENKKLKETLNEISNANPP